MCCTGRAVFFQDFQWSDRKRRERHTSDSRRALRRKHNCRERQRGTQKGWNWHREGGRSRSERSRAKEAENKESLFLSLSQTLPKNSALSASHKRQHLENVSGQTRITGLNISLILWLQTTWSTHERAEGIRERSRTLHLDWNSRASFTSQRWCRWVEFAWFPSV